MIAGKATEKARAKASSQRARKSLLGPRLTKVITIDIRDDMNSEVKKASRIGAWRGLNLGIDDHSRCGVVRAVTVSFESSSDGSMRASFRLTLQ